MIRKILFIILIILLLLVLYATGDLDQLLMLTY